MRRALAAVAIAGLTSLAACATGEQMSSLQEGMTKDEVIANLGRPGDR